MILSPNEVVRDSYRHFTCDLGITPTSSDLFADIRDNYEGYAYIDDDIKVCTSFVNFIEERCLREGFELREE